MNIQKIEKSIQYYKAKLAQLPGASYDQNVMRLEKIFKRRIEVLEQYKKEINSCK